MAGIPSYICHLRKNKFIGNQRGFVDSFNWVADSLYNLKGGDGIDIQWNDGTHPEISLTADISSVSLPTIYFTGTDGTNTDVISSEVVFAAAADSNIKISCDGNTITIGAYYV